MEKRKTVTKEETEVSYFCDICGDEIPKGFCFYQMHQCHYCHRLMCDKHSVQDPLDCSSGDYQQYICTDCKKISTAMVEHIQEVRAKAEKEEEELYKSLRALCKKGGKT